MRTPFRLSQLVVRVLTALMMVGAVLVWAGSTASSAAAASGSGSSATTTTTTSGPLPASQPAQAISMVRQTTWVTPGVTSQFDMVVHLAGVDPATTSLNVWVCPRLLARLNFAASLDGHENAYCYYQQPVTVASLPVTGGVDRLVALPLYQSKTTTSVPAGALPMYYGLSSVHAGVYPIQLTLSNAQGVTIGEPVTTYMVSTPSVGVPHKLAVSWVLPVAASGSDPSKPLSATQSANIESEVSALAAHRIPLTLSVDPSTLTRLGAEGTAGRKAVASLAAVAAGGDELLPQSYVPIDVAGMTAAGQDSEIALQYQAGAAVLVKALGKSPITSAVASTESPVQPALVGWARSQGATGLVVPGAALSPLPVTKTSFAQTTTLAGYSGITKVAGSDSALALHFTNGGDQVLQAQQLLAELAIVALDAPGDPGRGLAIVVPQGWQPSAAFLNTVLAGLGDSPLLQPETLQSFFKTVGLGADNGAVQSRGLLPAPPAAAVSGGADITRTRALIDSLSSTIATSSTELAGLENQVLVAESSDLSPAERNGILSAIAQKFTPIARDLRLAPQLSVTLTSTSADVPVTILNSGTSSAQVELTLSSQKLSFRSFTSTAGACSEVAQSTEICTLMVPVGATLLKVPVETRTSGVFALDLALRSGNGAFLLDEAHYTVRSTAVSDVALGLMVVAAILLGAWWIRDRRHGRRARKLVDPPSEEFDAEVALAGVGVGGGGPVSELPSATGGAPVTVAASPPSGPRLGRSRRRHPEPQPGVAEPDVPRWSPAPPTRTRPVPPTLAGAPAHPDGAPPRHLSVPARHGDAVTTSGGNGTAGGDRSGAPGLSSTEPQASPSGDPSSSADPASLWVDDDPVVAEFFATPPPTFASTQGSKAAPEADEAPAQGGPPGANGSGRRGPPR